MYIRTSYNCNILAFPQQSVFAYEGRTTKRATPALCTLLKKKINGKQTIVS